MEQNIINLSKNIINKHANIYIHFFKINFVIFEFFSK